MTINKSNLVRAYSLSVPTAQACCEVMRIYPMSKSQMTDGLDQSIADVLVPTSMDVRTPLWFYVLREAAYQQNGNRLGELGSRIVCETIIGMLKGEPNSYLNNEQDTAVTATGIVVDKTPKTVVKSLVDLLNFVQVANIN